VAGEVVAKMRNRGEMTSEGDRVLIHELINLHGHMMDEGRFERFDELFTDDVVYDTTAFGGEELHGAVAIVEAGRALGDRNALGHHVTNVVVVELLEDQATVVSKGIGIRSDGSAGSLVYEDVVRRTTGGWRIAHRRILPRRHPLRPSAAG
jgi:SnoaL-like domain